MSNQIIKQPDGKYAVWSTVVDAFTMIDATPNEIIEDWLEEERSRIAGKVHSIVQKLEAGEKPYFQFTMSWSEALRRFADVHGHATSLEKLRAQCEERC